MLVCKGRALSACVVGALQPIQDCPSACVDERGCTACAPDSRSCDGDVAKTCRHDGNGAEDAPCDPVQGMICNASTGRCRGKCAPDELGQSYIGCEYHATEAANDVDASFAYAVVVANAGADTAHVLIEGVALQNPIEIGVPAGNALATELPWLDRLKQWINKGEQGYVSTSALVPGGAFHLRSTSPVSVYQFNPLDFMTERTIIRIPTTLRCCSPCTSGGTL